MKNPGKGAGRIARSSWRPAKKAANGVRQAEAIVRRFTPEELVAQLGLTEEQVAFLDRCASGHPPRNALAGISAVKLKLEYSQPKPLQRHAVGGGPDGTGPVEHALTVRFVEPASDG